MISLRNLACSLLLFVQCMAASAQYGAPRLTQTSPDLSGNLIYRNTGNHHTSVRPYLEQDFRRAIDSIQGALTLFLGSNGNSISDSSNARRTISFEAWPMFQGLAGQAQSDSAEYVYETGIGVGGFGRIGKQITCYADYLASSGYYPDYQALWFDSVSVYPGQGKVFREGGAWQWQRANANIAWTPSATFNLQIGHGKHFFGDGYRSLLLSDVAPGYSFAKITTTAWRIRYTNLFANFKDYSRISRDYRELPNKYGAFHYLSMNVTKWLQVSIFEGVIWGGRDTLNNRNFDVNYLNPVAFYRPVEYSIGSADNSLLGGNVRLNPWRSVHLYGQLLLDEFLLDSLVAGNGWWANKYGWQAGLRWVDVCTVKNLTLLAEYNSVRPFTYTHHRTAESYTHQNMPLAHPYGAGFNEVIGLLRYNYKNVYGEVKFTQLVGGMDTAGANLGSNILKSYSTRSFETGNRIAQGNQFTRTEIQSKVGFLVHPANMLVAEVRVDYRIIDASPASQSNLVFWLGVRTAISSLYTDFF